MSGAIPPLLQYAFMAWSSVKAQGQLYLYRHEIFHVFMNSSLVFSFSVWKVILFTPWSRVLQKLTVTQSNSLPIMEPNGSLPYTQEPNTGSYPDPHESRSRLATLFETDTVYE
jgi:hypothetical protein